MKPQKAPTMSPAVAIPPVPMDESQVEFGKQVLGISDGSSLFRLHAACRWDELPPSIKSIPSDFDPLAGVLMLHNRSGAPCGWI
jgi:hypothetical protein